MSSSLDQVDQSLLRQVDNLLPHLSELKQIRLNGLLDLHRRTVEDVENIQSLLHEAAKARQAAGEALVKPSVQEPSARRERQVRQVTNAKCDFILAVGLVVAVVGASLIAAALIMGWGVPALAISAVVLAGGLLVAGAKVVINCLGNQESSAG